MDRTLFRTFVISAGHAVARTCAIASSFAYRGGRLRPAHRCLTGFVLLAFALTQIIYPMDLLAAGRNLSKNTPPDSFLRQQVNSVPDLVSEIQHNLAVRRNYARHFGLPVKQIAGYLRKNLVIRKLQQPYRHVVYCVRPDGVFFVVRETMPVGTKVFALKTSGRPVLKWACGNPFTKRLPHPDSVVTFLRRSKPSAKKPTEITAADVEVVTPNEAPAFIAPTEAVLPSTEVIGALPLSPASFVIPAGVVGGGGGSLLPFLPLIPVLFAVGGGGGSSHGGGTTATTGGGTSSTSGATTGGSTATTGGSTATTGGSTATTGGSTATTGGTTATTGGTTATTGGTTATTGGTTATTGGTTATTGGSTATTGSSTATTGGTTATTGGMTATTGGMTSTTGGTTAGVVPELSGSSTLGYAFLALALLAFASSTRRKRKLQE